MLFKLREAEASDLNAILEVQKACYYDIEPESAQSMRTKILGSPSTCFVCARENAQGQEEVGGYLLALPIERTQLPPLNAPVYKQPVSPDCLYLHDMAVSPAWRGSGVASALLEAFERVFNAHDFKSAALVAIQGSSSFWQKQGFSAVQGNATLQRKLMSYGETALYMEMERGSITA